MVESRHSSLAKSGGVFAGVAALWLVFDQLTKAYFQNAYTLGQVSASDFGHRATALETCALSLIAAGGIGNAIDRFVNGFVVDFIDLTFMDFPVFNIADIGVTCGFVLLVIGYLLATRPPSRKETTPSCDEGKEAHHD